MKLFSTSMSLSAMMIAVAVASPAHADRGAHWSNLNASGPTLNSGRSYLPGPSSHSGRMSLMEVANNLVPLAQVLETINAQEPGSQLDTNTIIENGKTIYIVRWQASRGRIIIFRVDAESGQIIGRQG